MKYLLDTCIISELVKPNPSKKVTEWLRSQDETHLYLSVLTLGEIYKGIEKIKSDRKKKEIHLWVQQDLKERFKGRILPVDVHVAMLWGRVQGKAERRGRAMPAIDGLIAATGLAFEMVVVTRNVADMRASGVTLFNPWEDAVGD